MHLVRFKGKFTELIPDGWKFQKLFANNYRQYHKTCDGSEWTQGCRIWQHHGGYLEIEDLYGDSWVIVKQIMDGRIKELESQTPDLFTKGQINNIFWLKHDKEKHTFYPWHSDEYKAISEAEWAFVKLRKSKAKSEMCQKHWNRYREFNMRPELVAMIQGMIDKGWLAIEEVPDPK